MPRTSIKRAVDLQIIDQWIAPNSRVLDLGCGPGLLLEHLIDTKKIYGLGVDIDISKIIECIKRGVNAYQGTAEDILDVFDENSFDWIVCSRTLQDLQNPYEVLSKALKISKYVAIGFVNYGFWENRLNILLTGQRPVNDVYTDPWYRSKPENPVNISGFEAFCKAQKYTITHKTFLDSTWRKPCHLFPSIRAGYAIYEITK
jgi:methionine biosynthesis protein MetW